MRNNKVMLQSRTSAKFLPVSNEVTMFVIYTFFVYGIMSIIFPVMFRYDDGWILLASYSWANGLGFDNFWANPISSGIFNWHGFLQPVLVAWLMPGAGYSDVNFAVVLLGLINLAVWFLVVNIVVLRSSLRYLLYVIGVSAVLHFSARPELLASLWSMLIVLVLFSGPQSLRLRLRAALAGGLVGLAAVTSPAAGVLAGLGVAAAVTYLRSSGTLRAFLADGIVAMAAAAAAVVLMLWIVYPHEPTTWLAGIREHAALNALRDDAGNFIRYYVLTPAYPMLIVPLFITIMILALLLNDIKLYTYRLVFFVFSAILLFGVYYFGIRIPASYYNFAFAVPSICLAAAAMLERKPILGEQEWRLRQKLLGVPLLVFAIACGFSQVVWVAQKTASGASFAAMEQEIAERVNIYLADGRTIAMDPPLAIAIENVSKLATIELLFFGINKDPRNPPAVDVLVRAQTELGEMHDDVPGFRMVWDRQSRSFLSRIMKPLSLHYVIYEHERIAPEVVGSNPDSTGGDSRDTQLAQAGAR